MSVTLLNTSILTSDGDFRLSSIFLESAKNYVSDGFESAIGHQSTAEILSELLEQDVPVNRVNYAQDIGDVAIVFKVNGRPPEGTILSRNEIEDIGYSFKLLERLA